MSDDDPEYQPIPDRFDIERSRNHSVIVGTGLGMSKTSGHYTDIVEEPVLVLVNEYCENVDLNIHTADGDGFKLGLRNVLSPDQAERLAESLHQVATEARQRASDE